MEFLEDYTSLEPAQRDRFQQVITRLLAGEVLTPGSPLKPDADWRFAERFRELIDPTSGSGDGASTSTWGYGSHAPCMR